jgi:hypothetical protein
MTFFWYPNVNKGIYYFTIGYQKMDIRSNQDLIEHINDIIEFLSERETTFYVPLELAHQLRDELSQIITEDSSS